MFSSAPPQNTKETITDQGVTTTSSPTALHPRRLSHQPSPLTSWVLGPELWRDQATTLQTTKGSRTWYPTQKPPVQSRAYRAPCSRSRGKHTGADPVPLSPWRVTPATALQCPTKARKWEKPQPGKRTKKKKAGTIPGLNVNSVNSGEEIEKETTLWSAKVQLKFLWRTFWNNGLIFTIDKLMDLVLESSLWRWRMG